MNEILRDFEHIKEVTPEWFNDKSLNMGSYIVQMIQQIAPELSEVQTQQLAVLSLKLCKGCGETIYKCYCEVW